MNECLYTEPQKAGVIVCIPVHNEADSILDCLAALARQDYAADFDVLLLLNNCTDATALIAGTFCAPSLMRVHVVERWLPPRLANAGNARRIAMAAGRELAGDKGVLLCTDADAVVPPNWISRSMQLIAEGADAVAGRIEMAAHDAERLPRRMHDDEAAAQLLTRLMDEIDWLVDPDPADPWPRHTEHSGASIAVTCAAHDAAGGVPAIASSEDRAFFAALRRVDARIRHATDVVVTVSGRLEGRAAGGMAETLKRRLAGPDRWLDDCIEGAEPHYRRACARRALRALYNRPLGAVNWGEIEKAAAELALQPQNISRMLQEAPSFGALWHTAETKSSALRRRRVRAKAISAEIAAALAIIQGYGDAPDRSGFAPLPMVVENELPMDGVLPGKVSPH